MEFENEKHRFYLWDSKVDIWLYDRIMREIKRCCFLKTFTYNESPPSKRKNIYIACMDCFLFFTMV